MVDTENLVWGVDLEVNLLHAMRGHKPVGNNFEWTKINLDLIRNSNYRNNHQI